jgi:hypothetical protein
MLVLCDKNLPKKSLAIRLKNPVSLIFLWILSRCLCGTSASARELAFTQNDEWEDFCRVFLCFNLLLTLSIGHE